MSEHGWAEVTMGEVMAEFYDGPHATPPPSEDGPVYLGIRNLSETGHLDLTQVRHIAESDFPKWTKRVEPRPGDIVFTYEATLHRYAIIPEGFRGSLGRRIALIRPDLSKVDRRYLHYYLLSPQWRRTIEQRINVGSTVDRIPLTEFPDYPFPLPPLSHQRAVVSALGAIDDLIANNRRRIENLEEIVRLIYREWFVHFRFPGHADIKFVDSDLGPIPEGWRVLSLGEVAEVVKGLSYKGAHLVGEGVPMANLKCLAPDGGFRRGGVKPYDGPYKDRHSVEVGDIVVANTDLTQAGNVIGSAARVPAAVFRSGGLLSHHLFRVRPKGGATVGPDYLLSALQDTRFREWARSCASGTTVLGFRREDAERFPVLRPSQEPAGLFEQTVQPLRRLAEVLEDQGEVLAEARDLLLPRLISGELDVSDLDLNLEAVA